MPARGIRAPRKHCFRQGAPRVRGLRARRTKCRFFAAPVRHRLLDLTGKRADILRPEPRGIHVREVRRDAPDVARRSGRARRSSPRISGVSIIDTVAHCRPRFRGSMGVIPGVIALGGRPNSRTLLRTVRRLTPNNSAARARFPPVASSVMAKSCRSISPSDNPGFPFRDCRAAACRAGDLSVRKSLHADFPARRERHRAPHKISPAPARCPARLVFHPRQQVLRDSRARRFPARAIDSGKMPRQFRDVARPLPQRRQRRAESRSAGNKDRRGNAPSSATAASSGRFVVAITRMSTRTAWFEPSRSNSRSCSARSSFGCKRHRHLAHLVEQQRSPARHFEFARPRPDRSRERAPRVPEQFALEQSFRKRGAVDRHKRSAFRALKR